MTTERKQLMVLGLWGLGGVTGVAIAIKRKSGFWGGLGWFLLCGAAGTAVGWIITSAMKDQDTTTVNIVITNDQVSRLQAAATLANFDIFEGITADQIKQNLKNASSQDVEDMIALIPKVKANGDDSDDGIKFIALLQKATGKTPTS